MPASGSDKKRKDSGQLIRESFSIEARTCIPERQFPERMEAEKEMPTTSILFAAWAADKL